MLVTRAHGGSYKGTWWQLQGPMVAVTRAHGGSYRAQARRELEDFKEERKS